MKLENARLSLTVNPQGGSLHSLFDKKKKEELIYQPHEDSWKGQDVVIFPFIARLKKGTYTYKGKEYGLKNHGLIRYDTGKEVILSESEGYVSFTQNEETLARYPFAYKVDACYRLKDSTLFIDYRITNDSSDDLPFMIGAHPAFRLPGKKTETEFDISGNRIVILGDKKLTQLTFEETGSFITGKKDYGVKDCIELDQELFRKEKTLLLVADQIDSLTLEKSNGSSLTVHKKGIPYLAIWSDGGFGDYVAIEPWNGYPDWLDNPSELTLKKGILTLAPKKTFVFSYQIEVH